MPICKVNLDKAIILIGEDHTRLLVRFAKQQDRLEILWTKNMREFFSNVNAKIAQEIARGRTIDQILTNSFTENLGFDDIIFEHFMSVASHSLNTAEVEQEFLDTKKPKRLGKLPRIKIPRTLKDLQIMYDKYRREGLLPKRQKKLADQLKKHYLERVQTVWQKYSGDFREGVEFDQEEARRVMEEASRGAKARAKTIVETETTNYYNQVRKDYYDKSDAVTHYLFLAIRDQATTKWCSDQVRQGKRGRHGLVYTKGDPLTDKETPACHWNCRSEMVPLSPYNPRHQRLLKDESKLRRNNECHPLPKGWS